MNAPASISCKSFKYTLMKTAKKKNNFKEIRPMVGFGWSHNSKLTTRINKAILF